MSSRTCTVWVICALLTACAGSPVLTPPLPVPPPPGPRAHELGIHIGPLPSGALDAITDVPGVAVGHATLQEGEQLHTGVTVILPRGGGSNPFRERCNAAIVVQNGFGKLIGSTQVQELGELESPIALCGTLNVFRVADGVLDWLLELPGNEDVLSVNVVVGETNDGRLSDIRSRPLGSEHVRAAIEAASAGEAPMPVPVGSVGAGAGTVAFGWKGGIGTASRVVDGHTVGVLVQSNFGGRLVIDGLPMHKHLPTPQAVAADHDGSCMIVVACDAPLDAAALQRLATRAFTGMARTGASFSSGSGDYAIAFSTAEQAAVSLRGDALSPLFAAVADATEQAIIDSMCAALTTTGMGRVVPALPLQRVSELLAARERGEQPK